MGADMTEKELDEVARLINDVFEQYKADFVEAIYILDRLKYGYNKSLDEITEKDEDNTAKD